MNSSTALVGENQQDAEKQSAEKFQKFMFDLFEKNGVINDLRAYLRGHIVNVIKTTQSGETLTCQKHFTQRLELTFQAINILIAEYLLRLEFSYTLSVFVSEIPLANMVFSFARMLMETHDHSELRFKDADVFSILNYIGLKCDADHANSVVEMYNDNKKTPLLLCIFKCLPMYNTRTEPSVDNDDSSTEGSLASVSSMEKCHHKSRHEKCKHYTQCKTCRARIAKLKEKYKRKERGLEQNLRQSSINSLNVESFLKNISVMEKGLINELFQQLKSVYEAEMEMVKQEENKRVQRSLVAHAVQLQKKKEQLESSFKAREAALAEAIHEKKRVLWSVARILKQQHEQMARAMADVNTEAKDLALKEESLKTQLAEAETSLRNRGENMRKQISKELTVLSKHLESMKQERDNINRERTELEHLKLDSPDKENRSNYNLLKDELLILKKYVQNVKSQNSKDSKVERGTMTDLSLSNSLLDNDVVLNNRKEVAEDAEIPKRLVNDLKKQKNVNFEQMTTNGEQSQPQRVVYDYQQHSRSRSRSSSEAGDAPDDEELILLKDENRRLKDFARQQKEHIDSLMWQHTRMQAQISSQTSNLPPPTQPIIMPRTSNYTPQISNIDLQTGNVAPQPASYATTSANFPSRSTSLNAQSATLPSQVAHVTPLNFSQTSPFTFNFAARSAFLAPQSSTISPQIGTFVPQSGTFGTPESYQANAIQRPRTASPTGRRPIGPRLQPSTSVANLNVGWRVGAGEELSVFTSVPTRVVLPGDDVPFIGVVGNRHTDNRRYLINQWRSLRRRLSPVSGVTKRPASASRDKPIRTCIKTGNSAPGASIDTSILLPQKGQALSNLQPSCSKNNTSCIERNYLQLKSKAEKGLKVELKLSKERLREEGTKTHTALSLENSPSSVLREAKLRLRKLEIEAEAVEKSYVDFRRKRESKKEERDNSVTEETINSSSKKLNETNTKETQRVPPTLDIEKLLNDIHTKLDLPSFKNNNLTEFKINPIPKAYSEPQDTTNETQPTDYSEEPNKENYIETPINEFRRLYHSERRLERKERRKSPTSKSDSKTNSRRDTIIDLKNDKEKELEIFKHKLGKIYNMSENSIFNYPSEPSVNEIIEIENDIHENISDLVENQNEQENISDLVENGNEIDQVSNIIENENIIQEDQSESKEIQNFFENTDNLDNNKQIEGTTDKNDVPDKNLLRIDVESLSESNTVQVNESRTQGFVLFVASSVDNAVSESENTKISTQMTIVVSPKRSPNINTGEKTIERAPDLSTNILEPQYDLSNERISSIQMQLSKDAFNTTLSEIEINEDPDYPDDFSADVDNYNSLSEYRNQSPISLGKTSDDENFWES